MRNTLAVVAAAGEGQRFGTLPDDRPKWVVEVLGRPLIAHVYTALVRAGIGEIVVLTQTRDMHWAEPDGSAPAKISIVSDPGSSQFHTALAGIRKVVASESNMLVVSADMLGDPADFRALAVLANSGASVCCAFARQEKRTTASWEPVLNDCGQVVDIEVAPNGGHYERLGLFLAADVLPQTLTIGEAAIREATESSDQRGLGWTVTRLIKMMIDAGMVVYANVTQSVVANVNRPDDVVAAVRAIERYDLF